MTFDVATEIVVRRAAKAATMRAWRAANPERARENARRSMARFRENNREQWRATKRRSYWNNVEKERERARERGKQNREYVTTKTRQWRIENRERHLEQARVYASQRRALKLAAEGFCSTDKLIARFQFHGNCCVYCGATDRLTVDHMIPLARGGTNWPANLVPACETCNGRKHTKTYFEFVALLDRAA